MSEQREAVFQWDPVSGSAAWVQGKRLQHGELEALAACGADEFIWLVDAREVSMVEVELPAANRRAQIQALPFAMEDQLLSPVEQLSFAFRRLSPTRLACAVFDGGVLQKRLAALAAVGIEVTHAVPDVLCVPWQEDAWTLLVDDTTAFLRTERHAGYRFPLSQWPAFVGQASSALDDQSGRRQKLRLIGGSETLAAQLAAAEPLLLVSHENERRRRLRVLAGGFIPGTTLDLLEALPGRRRAAAGSARRWWLATAAVLAGAAVAHSAFLGWHVRTLEERVTAERAETLATFQELFPLVTRVEDVRVQAMQALAELDATRSAGPQFLDALAQAAAGMPADAGMRLEHIGYGNGALELRVVAPDMSVLERYQQSLADARLPVQLVSVEARESKAVGLLRIGGGG
jgi:general secretion pathway protein L